VPGSADSKTSPINQEQRHDRRTDGLPGHSRRGWAQAGNRVWVFEGHPSGLSAGLEQADYLLVDSGTLPYLQEDWMAVALRSMKPEGKVFHYNRETGMFFLSPYRPGRPAGVSVNRMAKRAMLTVS